MVLKRIGALSLAKVGLVGALIMAGLYNWMAAMVGGVQLELE